MKEVEHIIDLLEKSRIAFEKSDSATLKELSDQTIHTSSIEQDPENATVAVIIYALSKVVERPDYRESPNWERFYKNILKETSHLILALKENNIKEIRTHLKLVRKSISDLSGNLKKNIEEVLRKAQVNKASKIYAHGLSREKTAKLLGVTSWELADYIGEKELEENKLGKTMDVRSRIKMAEEIFHG